MQFAEAIRNAAEACRFHKKNESLEPPTLEDPVRFPYGPFRFKTELPKGVEYLIVASTDLKNWVPLSKSIAGLEPIEYIDSEAYKFSNRFYQVRAEQVCSRNILGYVSITLPPGFSMIANPLQNPSSRVSDLFRGWPDGTSLSKYDPRLFRVEETTLKDGKWTNSSEKLVPGEGAIFFNPTQDYKTHSFVGEILQGNLTMPIPPGFSMRSSLLPNRGSLDELHFPISEGDVIHLFDRDQQKYHLYCFENGKWANDTPLVGLAESFWVAKAKPGNWVRRSVIAD